MSKADVYIARMKSRLAEARSELYELEARARDMQTEAGESCRKTLHELHDKRVAIEARLEAIAEAGEDVRQELKDDAEKTWTAFKAGLDALRDFSDHA